MTRTSLDDAQWVSLLLMMQQIPFAWQRNEVVFRRVVEAVLWRCRTGAPWRDLPEALGHWSSVYHRWRRWCRRGGWEVVFEAMRPSLPADGLLLLDSTTGKAHRAASGAVHKPDNTGSRLIDHRISAYQPKAHVAPHRHTVQEQVYHMLEGEGLMEIKGRRQVVRRNDVVFIPPASSMPSTIPA